MKKIITSLVMSAIMAVTLGAVTQAHAEPTKITVYKDPNCGCCGEWVTYMEKAGYHVQAIDSQDMQSIKSKYKVPEKMQSCHTSIVESTGQVIEGHVPVSAVEKMLKNPKVKGLAVPGMKSNSPGMGEMNGNLVTYDFNNKEFSKD